MTQNIGKEIRMEGWDHSYSGTILGVVTFKTYDDEGDFYFVSWHRYPVRKSVTAEDFPAFFNSMELGQGGLVSVNDPTILDIS